MGSPCKECIFRMFWVSEKLPHLQPLPAIESYCSTGELSHGSVTGGGGSYEHHRRRKRLKTIDCFRMAKIWKHQSLFYSPKIWAFHSLSTHILQILLTPPLKYREFSTFSHLHHCFGFDVISFFWLSAIAGEQWQKVVQGTCPFIYPEHHRKTVLCGVTCFLTFCRTTSSLSTYPQCKNHRNTDPQQTNSKETDKEIQNSNCWLLDRNISSLRKPYTLHSLLSASFLLKENLQAL